MLVFYFIVKGKSLFRMIFAIKMIVKSSRPDLHSKTMTNILLNGKKKWMGNVDPPKIKILIRDSRIKH